MSMEAKIAAVTARWKELHSNPEAIAKKKQKQSGPPIGGLSGGQSDGTARQRNDGAGMTKGGLDWNDRMKDTLKFFDLYINIPKGVKNESWNLTKIKEPVTWFGHVAVGEDCRWAGWWNVVPPAGFMVSYCGGSAKSRAFDKAAEIMDMYK